LAKARLKWRQEPGLQRFRRSPATYLSLVMLAGEEVGARAACARAPRGRELLIADDIPCRLVDPPVT